ncbi:hypothetical protein AB0A95_33450 [Micromonospora sp. NPDC049230]|uniref:hypothetical protein n=1 Tax=Micromonospora sp. NPDC049230 TaxID=3155502 RepID=UPI0033F4BFA9
MTSTPQIQPAPVGSTVDPTAHRWQGYSVLAIESAGDATITAVLPETLERLTVSTLDTEDAPGEELNTYDQLRRLIDAMEAVEFFG